MRRALARAPCIALDAAIVILLAVILAIVVTGGGAVEIAGLRVRARTIENPLGIVAALVLLRYAISRWSPFLGIDRWPVERILDAGWRSITDTVPACLTTLFGRPMRALAAIGLVVFTTKALLAWTSPGFFSGDDVEVHEMSLGVLLGKHWPIWELRSAFFPMVFIYPAQRLATALGVSTPESLVWSGRLVVALLSTAVIPLTWLAARRLVPDEPRLAALAALFVALDKLQMSFGSSELPRPVSTIFVVGAFLATVRPGRLAPVFTGVLIGIAAAFRFSEVVFLPAALVTLGRERWMTRAAMLVSSAAVTLGAIVAVADTWYWGRAFSSVVAAVDFTLVDRLSSRGYEPPWAYATLIPFWSTPLVVSLALAGSSRRHPDTWWLWLPIGLLSVLPHKETRYLIPVTPFLSIAAARGLLRAIASVQRDAATTGWRRWSGELLAPALLLSVLHQMGGWRLVRSNEGVRLAQALRTSQVTGVAAQDPWRLGGHVYLWPHEPVIELPPELLTDERATAATVARVGAVALRMRTARTIGDSVLQSQGFERVPEWRGEDYVWYARRR